MRLAAKILAALVLAVAVALVAASWLIDHSISGTYRAYLDNASRRRLEQTASQAAQLYALQPDWQAIQSWIDQTPRQAMMGAQQGRGLGRMQGRGMGHPQGHAAQPDDRAHGILVDPTTGTPLAGGGAPVSAAQLAAGVPVQIDAQTVALLVPANVDGELGAAEAEVLAQVQNAIFSAALIGGIVALILGGFLAWTISRPVRALHQGVQALAAGERQTQVRVHAGDELGELAASFNRMAQTLHQQEELRRRMVSDIAHELRTPLSVVQGNLQAILDGVYPLALSEIETVYAETELLSRLVHDLHELALAEAGNLPLELQLVNVASAVEQMAASFSPLAESKQITIKTDAPASNVTLQVDPDRLQQILHNLLGNAIRHTPPGGSVRLAASQPAPQTVRLEIANTGSGIAPEKLPHIFERFYRGDNSRSRQDDPTAGSGLGLAISRALTEAHGGVIGVTSSPDQGVTFWIEFPQNAVVPDSKLN